MFYDHNISLVRKRRGSVNLSFARYIPSTKVGAFETIFKSLINYYGSATKAEKEMGVNAGHSVIATALKNKKLSEYYAKKILNKYNEVKEIKKRDLKND